VVQLREQIKVFLASQGLIKGHSGSGSRASDDGPPILRLSVDQHHSDHPISSSGSPSTRSLSLSDDDC
jgi:hypothetical protein